MTVPPYRAGARFVVVGDIQRTAPVLEFWREQNDVERARVIAALARERPDLVLVTGDCVFDGGSDDQWAAFDRLTAPLREAGVPVASAFGNHEYWSGRAQAERHLLPRFPLDGGRHWFVVAMGPLRLVVLDSNLDELTTADQAEELAWYEDALDRFDRDPSVRGVLVAFHHPPFTNSTVTGDEPLVQRFFLPPFERARKTLALLNGHVHSYERFARGAKTYVVSGGGGGPRASLETGAARRHGDDRYDGPSLRDFNFSVYTVSDRGVGSEVRGLAKGGASFTVIDRFFLPWPSDEAPPPRPAGLIARSADRR
jgi:3',5'-cyclic AMP phosphodiesterase CpdA